MGLFCASIHIRSDDAAAVNAAADPTAVVLGPEAGWMSVYLPELLEGGQAVILDRAGNLSRKLGTQTVSFWVYDSDIACYWLHNSGMLIDGHNSWPAYFEEESGKFGAGDPEVLAGFCRKGTSADELRRLLTTDTVFAEEVVAGVATAIGLPASRVLQDYRDVTAGPVNDIAAPDLRDLADLAALLPDGGSPVPVSESAAALVNAAIAGDIAEIRRLAATGAPLDDDAPAPIASGQSLAGLGMAVASNVPQVPLTPLIAAIVHNQAGSVAALLDCGADPNHQHQLYGSPVHAAAGSGDPAMLTLVLDGGGDPGVSNRQGQSPLDVLRASRQQLDLLEQAKSLLGSLGAAAPDLIEQLVPSDELAQGWDECEAILHSRGEATE